MSEPQFTVGPWHVADEYWIDSATGVPIAKTTGNIDPYSGTYAGDKRNAHLIAAAPDLLAFVEEIVAELQFSVGLHYVGELPSEVIAAVRDRLARGEAALAKARGEAVSE